MVLPAFLVTDTSTKPLRSFLEGQGYAVTGWNLGRNLGPREGLEERLLQQLEQAARIDGKVSLVGWSLGGIFARQMAKARPDLVRHVISLGSPFRRGANGTNTRPVYEWVTGHNADEQTTFMAHNIEPAPPVPFTAIYSRWDGICAWQCCVTEPTALAENIEVHGSHCGLGHNPAALYAIADRLAGQEFKPFSPPLPLTTLYPTPWARAA